MYMFKTHERWHAVSIRKTAHWCITTESHKILWAINSCSRYANNPDRLYKALTHKNLEFKDIRLFDHYDSICERCVIYHHISSMLDIDFDMLTAYVKHIAEKGESARFESLGIQYSITHEDKQDFIDKVLSVNYTDSIYQY